MEGPLVSVVVPVYRARDSLARCVDSVLAQSHRALEVILVEDGCPDGSGALCDDYARRDARVRVAHQAHAGAAVARNTGMDLATGACLCFVDADDSIAPGMVEYLYGLLAQHDADMACCGFYSVYPGRQVAFPSGLATPQVMDRREAFAALMYEGGFETGFSAKLFRAGLLAGHRFTPGRYHEDLDLLYRVVLDAERVVASGEPLYYYMRDGGASLSRSAYSPDKMAVIDSVQAAKDAVADDPALLRAANYRYLYNLSMLLRMLAPKGGDLAAERQRVVDLLRQNARPTLTDRRVSLKQKLNILGAAALPGCYRWAWRRKEGTR